MWIHSAAFITTLAFASSTPDPSSASSGTGLTDDPRGVIVTAITTAGIILVALISTRHNSKTGPPAPSPTTPGDGADREQIGDIAVLEYRVGDLERRMTDAELRQNTIEQNERGPGAHRGTT